MPEGSQKFASESIFNFSFIFKLKFEFRVWPAVFRALLVFCSFFKNHKNQKGGLVYWGKKKPLGWFIGKAAAC